MSRSAIIGTDWAWRPANIIVINPLLIQINLRRLRKLIRILKEKSHLFWIRWTRHSHCSRVLCRHREIPMKRSIITPAWWPTTSTSKMRKPWTTHYSWIKSVRSTRYPESLIRSNLAPRGAVNLSAHRRRALGCRLRMAAHLCRRRSRWSSRLSSWINR